MFEITSEDGNARVGKLKTVHGTIKTPFFMPVATKAALKHVSQHELEQIGAEAIIANAFILYLKPGLEVIEKFHGIHNFMKWNKVIFTDSGGFQMLREDFLIKATDEGIHFKSPFDGTKHLITPEKAIEIENRINSDVAMTLDELPHYGNDYEANVKSVKRTHEWAVRCKKAHNNDKQLLFGIAQGSVFRDLREKSMKFIDELDFDGIALGGLCIGESKKEMYEMIDFSIKFASEKKPRYLMGVGSPADVINAIAHGVDVFDSAFPTRNARHNCLFTQKGNIDVAKKIYEKDESPIDEECDCYVCKHFSKAYMGHLIRVGEPLGLRYASIHNLHFVQKTVEKARKYIESNEFEELRKSFAASKENL